MLSPSSVLVSGVNVTDLRFRPGPVGVVGAFDVGGERDDFLRLENSRGGFVVMTVGSIEVKLLEELALSFFGYGLVDEMVSSNTCFLFFSF